MALNSNKKGISKEQDDRQIVTLRMQKKIVDLIEKERSKFNAPRGSWITQAVVEKLEKLGYEID